MSHETAEPTPAAPPPGGRFSWPQAGIWFALAPLLGVGVAWAAVSAQFFFAPLVVFPLLVGVGLGAMLIGLLRAGQIGNRPTLWSGALVAVLVTIAGQHYLSFRDELRHRDQERARAVEKAGKLATALREQVEAAPPMTFAQYMQYQAAAGRPLWGGVKLVGPWAWASWAIDGLLVLIATIAIMIPVLRQPYCDRCRSWYRTIRGGRLPAVAVQRVAEAAALGIEGAPAAGRYRLSNCLGGCGATRLELSWEDAAGDTYLNVAWLDAARRDVVGRVLDEGRA